LNTDNVYFAEGVATFDGGNVSLGAWTTEPNLSDVPNAAGRGAEGEQNVSKDGCDLLDGYDLLIPDDFAINLDEMLPENELPVFQCAVGGYSSIFPEMFLS
jgi:hypothetical protein